MNLQQPTKQEFGRNGITKPLLVNEIFYTIQGEGPFTGQPAVFIRLGGCNLQCTWCDTEYSANKEMGESAILQAVSDCDINQVQNLLVVITGGEPFRQNISCLCVSLVNNGYRVQVETNGTLTNEDFPWSAVSVVVSPKTKFLNNDIIDNAEYWKYIISSDDEKSKHGFPVYSTQQSDNSGAPKSPPSRILNKNIFLSPLDSCSASQNYENKKTVIDLCMKFGYTLSLQTHKILNLA